VTPHGARGGWAVRWITAYPGGVKEFLIFTAMRFGMFFGTLGVVYGVWWLIADEVPFFWAVLLAFILSGIASYKLLHAQRAALGARVEQGASRAAEKFEESKSKEAEPDA
jgi:hypothetical protein